MAIIGISSIHLLKTFIEAGSIGMPGAKITEAGVMWQTIIHVCFILSAIGIAYVDRMGQPGHAAQVAKSENNERLRQQKLDAATEKDPH
jgi:uncharacterized protein (TIGR00645 family)